MSDDAARPFADGGLRGRLRRPRAGGPWGRAALRCALAWAVAAAGCAAAAAPTEDSLKASFTAEIDAVASVGGVERSGDALTFVETREDGTEVQWRVVIESAAVDEPAAEGAPIQGHVVSSWYADGALIEPLGSMSRLPEAFLDAGIAQECYALWDEEAGRWGW